MFLSPQGGKNVFILLLLSMQHWFNFITPAIIKSHNQIQAIILYKETDSKGIIISKESDNF